MVMSEARGGGRNTAAKIAQVESSRMMAQGLADSRPLNDGLNPADRAANQRVEILVTKSRELR